jgi:hypothetical protein
METELERLTRHADEAQERCVERCMEQDLEAENAALWAFVRAWDVNLEGGLILTMDLDTGPARAALAKYELTEQEKTNE